MRHGCLSVQGGNHVFLVNSHRKLYFLRVSRAAFREHTVISETWKISALIQKLFIPSRDNHMGFNLNPTYERG
jgi:hypothetical protein